MLSGLIHAHSGLRWIVLVLLLLAIFQAFSNRSNSTYLESVRKIGLFALIATHIQFLLGLALYFMSPKVNFGEGWMGNSMTRFFGMEHFVMMLIAVILITIGYSSAKRAATPQGRYKKQWLFYLIGLIIMLAGIPWPFREALGASWF